MKNRMLERLRTGGASLVEYGMLTGLVAVASISAVASTGEEVEDVFCLATSTLASSLGKAGSGCGVEVAANGSGSGGGAADGSEDDASGYVAPDPDIVMVFDETTNVQLHLDWDPSGTAPVVNWGDGTVTTLGDGGGIHHYATTGPHRVEIAGDIQHFGHCDYTMPNLTSVESFGDTGSLTSLACAFAGNDSIASLAPLPPTVTDLTSAFEQSQANPEGLEDWDVSKVEVFNSMFENAKSMARQLENWRPDSALDMGEMFRNAQAFNRPIGGWDVSRVEVFNHMFYHAKTFNQPLTNWDPGPEARTSSMFVYASDFDQDLSGWCVNVGEPDNFAKGSSMGAGDFPELAGPGGCSE